MVSELQLGNTYTLTYKHYAVPTIHHRKGIARAVIGESNDICKQTIPAPTIYKCKLYQALLEMNILF